MTTASINDPRIDRLYQLLPVIHRMRDAEQGYPLQALLRVIAEQVNVVEDDIAQLYENYFIETAEDWAVPYVADLIGYRPVSEAVRPADGRSAEGQALNRVLIPRREVANTLRYRRRKGTLKLLELLARDVADWPAHAVEFYRLLGWNQNLNHQHQNRARTVDLRCMEQLGALDGPFDTLAHSVEVRRINSTRRVGRYNIPSVGVFLWRLKSYSVTRAPAYCTERPGPQCYTFSFLGQDAPLVTKPGKTSMPVRAEPVEACPSTSSGRTEFKCDPSVSIVAQQLSVPAPIGRLEFALHTGRFYGPGKSLEIWAEGWGGVEGKQAIPVEAIVAADLSDWSYVVLPNQVAVDPVLGRFAFPAKQLPKRGVRVSYHYGFSADMGGGEYRRPLFEPFGRMVDGVVQPPKYYTVGGSGETNGDNYARIGDAIAAWRNDQPLDAVIEVADSNVYVEPLSIALAAGQTLQLRAANRCRPGLRLIDYNTDRPDPLAITMAEGSRFTLDGFVVVGRPIRVEGVVSPSEGDKSVRAEPVEAQVMPGLGFDKLSPNGGSFAKAAAAPVCAAELVIRHCTLVPGWGLECDCEPQRPEEPSLELFNVRAAVRIEHSILGSIQINEDAVGAEPIPVCISDSILDSTGSQIEAIGAPGFAVAHALLTIRRSTVFGIVDVHAVELAENTLFTACINVARRQLGCMRFCYVPPGCRTPRRYHCQPDLVAQAVRDSGAPVAQQPALIAAEAERVRPQFTTERYGLPGYAQLALTCAEEIRRGADDESEMGAFHDLFQPQRQANLQTRLEEYTPAGCEVGMIFVT